MAMLDRALESELFLILNEGRDKDFLDRFHSMSRKEKEKFLFELPYKVRAVEMFIAECLDIAKGEDYLNQPEDGK